MSCEIHKYILQTIKLTLLTALALLCWQFSSVIFATQVLIMMAPWTSSSILEVVSSTFTIDYAISQLIATSLAYYCSFSNKKYIFAWHIGPAIGLLYLSIERQVKPQSPNSGISLKTIWAGLLAAISVQATLYDMLERTGFARSVDNGFALYRDLIVQWSFQAKVSFTNSIAACNPAYQNLNIAHLWELIKTLIVKPYCMYGVVMLAKFFRKWRKGTEKKTPSRDNVERAKKYVLEDFLEENHISMVDMSNKETENDLNVCLKLLEDCDYDYNRYKQERTKSKNNKVVEHEEFMNNIKLLKEQIKEGNQRRDHDNRNISKINHFENSREQQEKSTDGNLKPSISEDKATINSNSIPVASKDEMNDSVNGTNGTSGTFTGSSGMPNSMKNSDGNKNTRRSRYKSSDCADSKADYYSDIFSFQYVYSFVQMAVFTALGLSIKKLFFLCFTQGCVIAPTICSKFWYRKQRNIFWAVSLAVFLTSMANPGLVVSIK